MADHPEIPNHVAIDPASAHYWGNYKHVDVWFNGVRRRSDVSEFNRDEGWIKVHVRGPNGRHIVGNAGRIVTQLLKGTVTTTWRE